MDEHQTRQEFVEIGARMAEKSMIHGSAGNISVRLADGYILVSPTGADLGRMQPNQLFKLDIFGKVIGDRLNTTEKPTSETPLHLEIYSKRKDVNAIIHAHPPYCTAFAVAGIPLNKRILPEAVNSVGAVPFVGYRKPHTKELGEAMTEALLSSNAALMGNHGIVTVGSSLKQACYVLEITEFLCQVTILAKILGNINELTKG